MGEENYWLFRVIDKLVGEVRLVVENQCDVILTGNIFGGDDGEFVPGNVTFERNVLDSAARNRAAHRHAVEHFRESQVVDVQRRASDLLAAFFAGNGFADGVHRFDC